MNKHSENGSKDESFEELEKINQEIEKELYQLHYGDESKLEVEEEEEEEEGTLTKSIIFMYIMIGILSVAVIGKIMAIGLKLSNIL